MAKTETILCLIYIAIISPVQKAKIESKKEHKWKARTNK